MQSSHPSAGRANLASLPQAIHERVIAACRGGQEEIRLRARAAWIDRVGPVDGDLLQAVTPGSLRRYLNERDADGRPTELATTLTAFLHAPETARTAAENLVRVLCSDRAALRRPSLLPALSPKSVRPLLGDRGADGRPTALAASLNAYLRTGFADERSRPERLALAASTVRAHDPERQTDLRQAALDELFDYARGATDGGVRAGRALERIVPYLDPELATRVRSRVLQDARVVPAAVRARILFTHRPEPHELDAWARAVLAGPPHATRTDALKMLAGGYPQLVDPSLRAAVIRAIFGPAADEPAPVPLERSRFTRAEQAAAVQRFIRDFAMPLEVYAEIAAAAHFRPAVPNAHVAVLLAHHATHIGRTGETLARLREDFPRLTDTARELVVLALAGQLDRCSADDRGWIADRLLDPTPSPASLRRTLAINHGMQALLRVPNAMERRAVIWRLFADARTAVPDALRGMAASVLTSAPEHVPDIALGPIARALADAPEPPTPFLRSEAARRLLHLVPHGAALEPAEQAGLLSAVTRLGTQDPLLAPRIAAAVVASAPEYAADAAVQNAALSTVVACVPAVPFQHRFALVPFVRERLPQAPQAESYLRELFASRYTGNP